MEADSVLLNNISKNECAEGGWGLIKLARVIGTGPCGTCDLVETTVCKLLIETASSFAHRPSGF